MPGEPEMTQVAFTVSGLLTFVRTSYRDSAGDLGYGVFMQRLFTEFEKARVPNIVRNSPHQAIYGVFQYSQAPYELRALAVEAFFHIVRSGYAVEKPTEDYINPPGSLTYRWTDRGLLWINGGDPAPEEAESYLKFLRARVPQLDSVIEQYAVEAVTAFERQANFAAAVMLGAASEKALYMLADALLDAFAQQKDKATLRGLLDKRSLLRLFEYVRDALSDAEKTKKIPYLVTEGSTTHLMSIYESVRVQRNEAVHPMNASVSANSVRLLLASFPFALEKLEVLRVWLVTNKGSL